MDEKEYLQTLGEQIVNPHARASVLAEIQDHIEEQAQDYRASGMSEAVAMQEAVRQMGDPVSTGEALNQVHRPKFPIALFGLAVVLTVLGIAMQYLVYTHLTPDTAILSDTYLQRTILYNAIGLGLLLLCIFGNYIFHICNLLTVDGNTTLLDCTTTLRTCRNKTCFDQHGNKVNGSFFCEVFISQFCGRHMCSVSSAREKCSCAFLCFLGFFFTMNQVGQFICKDFFGFV